MTQSGHLPLLQRFEFETATLVRVRRGLFWLDVTWETRWKQGEAEYFSEDLGDGITLEMVKIPGGEFLMGLAEGQVGTYVELPRHYVTVPSFFMGKFAVTQAQYKAVMDENPSTLSQSRFPVNGLSWYDAVKFCDRLSHKTGRTYRLPSEAEWEYACRAGTTTQFHFGDRITTDLANYNSSFDEKDMFGLAPKEQWRARITEVGSFPPNAFGLYDMHGNVWEWCQDLWNPNYEGVPIDGSALTTVNKSAWTTVGEKAARSGLSRHAMIESVFLLEASTRGNPQEYRVRRGGDFGTHAFGCCSSTRLWDKTSSGNGVRVVLT